MSEYRKITGDELTYARRRVAEFYTDYERPDKEHVGIDSELQEGIALFLAMGMQTDASCWGHPERRNDPNALEAEKNLFPYISFTGYRPTDGLNEHGKAVGYSPEQVDAACVRMKHYALTLQALLDRFYERDAYPRVVELRYYEGMPAADLATHDAEHLESVSKSEQDTAIHEARRTWQDVLSFVQNTHLQAEK